MPGGWHLRNRELTYRKRDLACGKRDLACGN